MNKEKFAKLPFSPKGKMDVVLDTDAYNEIDDQFAIAYLLKCAEKCHTVALYAAPILPRPVGAWASSEPQKLGFAHFWEPLRCARLSPEKRHKKHPRNSILLFRRNGMRGLFNDQMPIKMLF